MPLSVPFPRYSRILVENCYPHSIWCPHWGWSHQIYATTLGDEKLEWWAYQIVKEFQWCVQPFWYNTRMWQTDGWMDRQTDGIGVAYTRYSIYVIARKNHWSSLRGHCRSYILTPIIISHMTIQAVNGNFWSILPSFRDITGLVLWTPTFSYPTPIPHKIWGCSPWTKLLILEPAEREDPGLTMRVIVSKLTQTIRHQYLIVTYRQYHAFLSTVQ